MRRIVTTVLLALLLMAERHAAGLDFRRRTA
jgi:hypothetical protein